MPEEMSALLGAEPTLARVKGQTIEFSPGRTRTAKTGQWHLEATSMAPENFDAQVFEILGQLTSNLSVWSELAQRFELDLYCGWFMEEGNEGLEISPATLLSLGERGIKVAVEIYGPIGDAHL
jgi:Domain of unknown function (DUF4279)